MLIAETIKSQLGHKALVMLGAKNLMGGANFLSFRIGKNSKSINYIKITLNGNDLYDIEYGYIGKNDYKIRSTSKDILACNLHLDIEINTGMSTRL